MTEEKTAMEMYLLFKKLTPAGKEAVLKLIAEKSKANSTKEKTARKDVALPSVVLPCDVTL